MAEDTTEDFWDLIDDFDTCMVVTQHGSTLRARPMAPRVSDERREILFLTERDTGKVEEVKADSEVALTFSKHKKYVSVSGRARISGDRQLVASIWDAEAEAWLPQGKDDPSVAVMIVDPHDAEIWDVTSNKIKQAFEFAKAYLGDKEQPDTTKHAKVSL